MSAAAVAALARSPQGMAPAGMMMDCPVRWRHDIPWSDDLPEGMAGQVVAPLRFDVLPEPGSMADRIQGYDAQHAPCYRAYRYVRTALRSDDDVSYYAAPVYAETLQAWRLTDERWLVLRTRVNDFDAGRARRDLTVQTVMPR